MGRFECSSPARIIFDDGTIELTDSITFTRDCETIGISLENETEIVLSYRATDEQQPDVIRIKPDYTDFEGKTKEEIESTTETMICEMLARAPRVPLRGTMPGQYAFVSLKFSKCSDLNEKIYRRFFNIGDNFSAKEAEENDMDKIANYKTGILIISTESTEDNHRRIQRLVNSRILHSRKKEFLSTRNFCPICQSKNIFPIGDKSWRCRECDYNFSFSRCGKCNNDIFWIRRSNWKEYIKQNEVTGDLENKSFFDRLSRQEVAMGEFEITSFALEEHRRSNNEITEWTLKSLCPHCGIKLGD